MRYDHHAYCKMISDRLKPIKGYLQSDSEEAPVAINTRLKQAKPPMLVSVEEDDYDFELDPNETLVSDRSFAILVLDKAEKGQVENIRRVKKNCSEWGKEIIAKIMLDHLADEDGLDALQPDSFSMEPVGPFGDYLYGMIIRFSHNAPIPFTLNQNHWEP